MKSVNLACDDARKELSVGQTGGDIAAHLAQCDSCRTWLADIERLEARIQGWRAGEPPEALKACIAAAVTAAYRSSWRKYFTLWKENPTMRRLSYTAVLVAAAICAIIFFMNGQAASAFDQMQLAVSHVKSAHVTIWYNTAKSGPVSIHKVYEGWFQDHSCRVKFIDSKRGGRTIIRRGDTYYLYDSQQHKVVSLRTEGVSRSRNHPRVTIRTTDSGADFTHFTLQELAGDYMPIGAHPHARLIGDAVKNGRHLQEIDLDLSDQGERMLFWVDPFTGLPVYAEKQDLDYVSGQWVVNGRFEFEFNQPLPASLFDPSALAPTASRSPLPLGEGIGRES